MSAPTVFVSYSHDSPEHKQWVLDLATRLRSSGVDAVLDQWDLGPGGDLPHFMEQSIAAASRVLMICTERYVQKANAGTGGVGYEKMIVTADLLSRIGSNRVIPIVRQRGSPALPTFLASKLYIDLSKTDDFETGFDQLLRELLSAPLFVKPPLGATPLLSAAGTAQRTLADPLTQLLRAVAAVYENAMQSGGVRTETVYKAMGVSKLLFHHALDLAVGKGYIKSGGTREILWITDAGREALIRLPSAPT